MISSPYQKKIAGAGHFHTTILKLKDENSLAVKKARALLRRAPGGGTNLLIITVIGQIIKTATALLDRY